MSILTNNHSSDENSILALLSAAKNAITITCNYKGITLSSEAIIVSLGSDYFLCKLLCPVVWLEHQKSVCLYSEELHKKFEARCYHTSIVYQICLKNLVECDSGWINRHFERVQPAEPIFMQMEMVEGGYRARIKDISPDGIGILVAEKQSSDHPLEREQIIQSYIKLPSKNEIMVQGLVINKISIGSGLTAIGLSLTPGIKNQFIKKYYFKRKKEILHEIENDCLNVREPRQTRFLFF